MSWADVKWAVGQSVAAGSLNAWAVLIALADRRNGKTGLCCPSINTLAKDTHLSPRSVRRALKDLRERHLIEVEIDGRSNRYELRNEVTLTSINSAECGHTDPNQGGDCGHTVTDWGHTVHEMGSQWPPNLRNITKGSNQAPLSQNELLSLVRTLSTNSGSASSRCSAEVTQAVKDTFGSWRKAGEQNPREFNFIGRTLHENYLAAFRRPPAQEARHGQ